MNDSYIQALQDAIQKTHGCASYHVLTVPLKEEFEGRTIWEGNVEVFDLEGHSKAQRCYAWGYKDDGGRWQYVAVLKLVPVDCPTRAVQAYILGQENK